MHLTSQAFYTHFTLKKHLFIHNFISTITTVIKIECFLTTFGACHKGSTRGYYSYKIEQKKSSHFPILGSMGVINWTIDFLDTQGFCPKIYFAVLVLQFGGKWGFKRTEALQRIDFSCFRALSISQYWTILKTSKIEQKNACFGHLLKLAQFWLKSSAQN